MPISPLSDATYDCIRQLIDQDQLQPGSRLPGENSLAQRFGISRPVVRQALARLRAEGRVLSQRGAGNFVGEPPRLPGVSFGPLHSVPDVRSFLEFRCILEGESAALAATHHGSAECADITRSLRMLEAALSHGEPGIEEDIAFHRAVAQASGNRYFGLTMDALAEQTRFAVQLVRQLSPLPLSTRAHDVRMEHRQIDEAIASGDAPRARHAMVAHLRGGIVRLFGR